MKAELLLGLDSGLTVTKAALFDRSGALRGVGRTEIRRYQPGPRRVERNLEEHWQASCSAIAKALAAAGVDGSAVAAIAIAGHGDGVYALDRDRQPLGRAILSLDGRAGAIVAGWRADGRMKALLERSGQEPGPAAPAPILAWMKANEPERYAAIGTVFYCKDWLRFRLTGGIATDRSEASVGFPDVHSQAHDREVLALCGLDELWPALPPIGEPCAIAGHVTAEAATASGLVAGTPVVYGLHDVTATATGMGVVEAGQLALVAGTYSINEVLSTAPVVDPGWCCRAGYRAGLWMNMAISPASSANIDWFVQTLCRDAVQQAGVRGVSVFDVLEPELAAAAGRNAGVVYHPFLYGSPHGETASAGFLGVLGGHDRGDLLWGLLQGVVFNHRVHVDALRRAFRLDAATLAGGGARNPRLVQLFADVLGLPVTVPAAEEVGALGVALCAGVGVGWYADLPAATIACCHPQRRYEPDPGRVRALDGAFAAYRASIDAIAPIWSRLGAAGA